jgi:hypothetical protein
MMAVLPKRKMAMAIRFCNLGPPYMEAVRHLGPGSGATSYHGGRSRQSSLEDLGFVMPIIEDH